ncbi:MBL fold metallo-hydrolase [Streptomyces sp. NPDC052101]|uniref:MBL fold metallo-hydrolase n=1 Tax=Streptomyces sp. NPDC052101 TaxID=3155763 RepID=UPI00341D1F8D
MLDLANGVTCIPTTRQENAYLVAGDDGFTLIDVGWAKAPGVLLKAVAELGRKPSDIRRLVLTHAHPDHVKGAAELRRHTGAEIAIHEADAAWLQAGRVPASGRSGAFGRLLDRLPAMHWEPVTPDRLLMDGQYIPGADGLRVIHTPGHSPGHIVLLHEPTQTLLVGDAIFNQRPPALSLGPDALAADPASRPAALSRLPVDVAVVGFAHGVPLTGAGVDAYTNLLHTLEGA